MKKKHILRPVLLLTAVLALSTAVRAGADDRTAGEDFHTWEMEEGVTGYANTDDDGDNGYSEEGSDAQVTSATEETGSPTGEGQETASSAYDENHDGDDTFVSNNGTTFRMPAVDNSERIFDFAGLLTDSDKDGLMSLIEKAEEEKKIAIIVLTSEDIPEDRYNSSETTKNYLTEFYVFNQFPEDGFAFVVDMKNRWLYTVGHGRYGDSSYNDTCTAISEAAMKPAKSGDYPGAVRTFVQEIHKLDNVLYKLIPTPLSLIISGVISGIVLLVLALKHRSSQPSAANVPALSANGYRKIRHDVNYLGTTRTRRHIERSSPSSGGGGFSSGGGGSSGGGFSGGGGSFSGGGSRF